MPLYEYQCDQCGDVFELIQRFSDQPLSVHPRCGGPVHRLISAPALQFKGTGWYITDYGRGSSAAGGSSDKNGSDKSDSGAKSTSEKKTTSESKSDSSKPSPASSPSAGK
jgi:putative FmdB family regulatory protein